MTRIPDRLLKSVVFLYCSELDAKNRDKNGGTGFIYGVKLIDNLYALYLVTNKHIVKNDNGTEEIFIQVNKKDGKDEIISVNNDSWVFHPHGFDIAITRLNLNPAIHDIGFIKRGPDSVSKEDISRFDFGPGDEVFMIGRFIGINNSNRVVPIVRYGNISSMPIAVPHPKSGLSEESLVIDMHSRYGFSGSPVFVQYSNRSESQGNQKSWPWSGERLIGINWGSKLDKIEVINEIFSPDKAFVKVFSNLNFVTPIWRIDEILDLDEHVEQRKMTVENIRSEGENS
jgi:hypothetical protein